MSTIFIARDMYPTDYGLVSNAYRLGVWGTLHGLSGSELRTVTDARYSMIMTHDGTVVIVAGLECSPGFAGGFVLATKRDDGKVAVHWVYVRKPYRKRGVAKMLLAELQRRVETDKIVVTCVPARWRATVKSLKLEHTHVHDFLGGCDDKV